MSDLETLGGGESATPQRGWVGRHWLVFTAAVLAGLMMVLFAAALVYTHTADFERRVKAEVVGVLENATGGRVELGKISFNLLRLGVEADGLVIHGTEGPGEMPYLSVAKIVVRLQLHTFVTHIRGVGPQSHVALRFLRVEQPHFHLIVDKDGKTNQPVPKHPTQSSQPIQDTLLDLQAKRVEVVQGLAVLNDRGIPLDAAARDLRAQVQYLPGPDSYGIGLQVGSLQSRMAGEPRVDSSLAVNAELGRDSAKLAKFEFDSGSKTKLTATGELEHFAQPVWKLDVGGKVDLKEVSELTDTQGLTGGLLSVEAHGHSCEAAVVAAGKKQPFWKRKKAVVKVGPPSGAAVAACAQGYTVAGGFQLHGGGYRNEYVRFRDIEASGAIQADPKELLLSGLNARFREGGGASGSMRIADWLGPGASHSYIQATVEKIPLRTIMDTSAPENAGDLGFDTSITGPVTVDWGGPDPNVADTVQVEAALQLIPTGEVRAGALNNVPVSGTVKAHYDGKREVVSIAQVNLETPATTLDATGLLGVNVGDPLTLLQVGLKARDLGEFDQLLHTLDLEGFGKKGTAAIPVVLHGTLVFNGTAKGRLSDLDVKGHTQADDVAVTLPEQADIKIDSLTADFEYAPNTGVAVASSTIKRGTAVLNVAGSFRPHEVVSRRGVVSYAWDNGVGIDATAKLGNAELTDLLQIAGQREKIPVTGTVSLNGHVQGTVQSLAGQGQVSLQNGVAYGEPYQSIAVNVSAQGQQIDASQVRLQAHNMVVAGSGQYNLGSKRLTAQLGGSGLQLSKFESFRKVSPEADGVLTFQATADGTLSEPGLKAKLVLAKITAQGKPVGAVNASAQSSGSTVNYQLQADVLGATAAATGQTQLTGGYNTQAKLTLSHLDVANVLEVFAPGTMQGSSNIAGTVTVSGPLSEPQNLAGTAEFGTLETTLENVQLHAAEPVRASLARGVVTLDQVHITGSDTDLKAAGTAQVFGDSNPSGGKLNLKASGNVSMALVHSFKDDLLTSGQVSFQMDVQGRMKKPELGGTVKVQNVDLALDGVANGLSNMNGTLVFNGGRLDVKDLTATTGGGQLKLGGYIGYEKGLFADLTATGDNVRVRLYGLSSTATANLRLQGSGDSMLISGKVLVTRFGVGPDVDFTAFAGAGGLEIPPDPTSITNKIRLDVQVSSAPQLDFVNSYAKLAGSVNLTVHGTVAVPTILGRIQITEGSATFAGTKYQLQRGSVTFSNPVRIDPVIDLDASAQVENYNITIGLHGTTTSLKPTYRSEPPLTEADIFNLLALGRTQEEAQEYQQQQIQAGSDPTTNALLGGALNATVSRRVSKLFGAGSVKIDPSYVGTLGNSSARITVEEPISKQVTLVFATNVNQTAQQLIQVQYQIDQSKSLVATRDENGVYSIVFKLRKRYR